MQNLSIGQPVTVAATCNVGYHDFENGKENHRGVLREEREPFKAVIVGQVVKYLGTYNRARHANDVYDGGDYEPASLSVDGSVTLWAVRTGMVNKELLVRDEDLEPFTGEYVLPRRCNNKPKFIIGQVV